VFKKAFCTLLFAALITCSLSAIPQEPNPAQALLSAGRVDDAIALLQRQLGGNKDNAEAQNFLARAYYAEEATDKAIQAGERAIELAPQNSVYHLWMGRIYGQKAERVMALRAAGFAGKVREQFEKAVQLDPNNMAAHADLAEFYVEAPGFMGGGKDKARAQADAIVSKDPALAHWIRALAADKDKNYAEAEKEYKAAIDSSGGHAEQWLNLAAFYQQRNRTPEMLDALNKAVAAPRKSNAIFFDAAGLLFHANQKLSLAAELENKYLVAKDKSEEAPASKAHLLMGQILEKQGDTAGAIKQYQAALALAKDFAPARDALKKLEK
jgi:tetratricopeptide (TPR) repeat protein